ncbi:hypothetical protein ACFE04_027031 [Oxalis oulophora]
MAEIEIKIPITLSHKTNKLHFGAQIFLRLAIVGTTLGAMLVTIYTKQSITMFGMVVEAQYNYADAFKYYVYANGIVCLFTIMSLFFAVYINRGDCNPANHFILFLHDLSMMSLELSGCTAATAVGYIAKYGNSHTGWLAFCDQFGKYCDRVTFGLVLGFLGFVFLLMLTVISANRARTIHV